jgi:hypothetical protein
VQPIKETDEQTEPDKKRVFKRTTRQNQDCNTSFPESITAMQESNIGTKPGTNIENAEDHANANVFFV